MRDLMGGLGGLSPGCMAGWSSAVLHRRLRDVGSVPAVEKGLLRY